MVDKICLFCSSKFSVPAYRRTTAKFCSTSCASTHRGNINKGKHIVEWTKKNGPYNKKNKTSVCIYCSTVFGHSPSRIRNYCSRTCFASHRKDVFSHGSGVYVKGYSKKHKTRKKHRIIAMEILGIDLTQDQILHHINGDRSDNRIENLQIMTQSEHTKMHMEKNYAALRSSFKRQC